MLDQNQQPAQPEQTAPQQPTQVQPPAPQPVADPFAQPAQTEQFNFDDIFGYLSVPSPGFQTPEQTAQPEAQQPPQQHQQPAPVPQPQHQPQQPAPQQQPVQQTQEQPDPYAQLVERMKGDPHLTAQVVQALQGQPAQQPRPEPEPEPEDPYANIPEIPDKPTAPTKPEGYNEADAYDPSTESGRYALQLRDYAAQMATYLAAKDERDEQIRQVDAQRQQQVDEYNQTVDFLAGVYRDLIGKGATPEQAKGFLEFYTQPQLEIDQLWQVYQYQQQAQQQQAVPQPPQSQQPQQPAPAQPANPYMTGHLPQPTYAQQPAYHQPQQQVPVQQQIQQMVQRQSLQQQFPLPSAAAPAGGSSPMRSESDVLMDAIIGDWKRSEPFQ